jgi:hypothetical protein
MERHVAWRGMRGGSAMWGYIARGSLFGALVSLCAVVVQPVFTEWKSYIRSWRVVSRQNLLRDLFQLPKDIGALILVSLWAVVFASVIYCPIWLGGGVLGGLIGWLIFWAVPTQ